VSELELRRMELDAQEKREQREAQEKRDVRRAELFKWFVAFAWPSVLQIANVLVQAHSNSVLAAKADKAAKTAAVAAEKVEEIDRTATYTAAKTAQWWAERTGDPAAQAKAAEAEARLESMEPQPASPPPNP
jgi:hypothetical protein